MRTDREGIDSIEVMIDDVYMKMKVHSSIALVGEMKECAEDREM